MILFVSQSLRYRNLLFELIRKEIKIRYKQSVIGPLWVFLQPIILMLLFTMIGYLLGIESELPYPLFAYVGLLQWTFFSNAVGFSTGSIVSNSQIIKKIYCPRELFPIASVATCCFDFVIGTGVLILLMLYYQIPFTLALFYLPVLLLFQVFLILGITLLTSAVAVYKRDVIIGMPLLLQFGMFASPVMYPVDAVPDQWRMLYMLNPMAVIIDSFRRIIAGNFSPSIGNTLTLFVISGVVFVVGLAIFRRLEGKFADVV